MAVNSKKNQEKKETKPKKEVKSKAKEKARKDEDIKKEEKTAKKKKTGEEAKEKAGNKESKSAKKTAKASKAASMDDMSAEDEVLENAEQDSDQADELKDLDPKVQKLLEYASSKQIVSWDEITDILTNEFVSNTKEMERVYELLNKNNIQIMEETEDDEFDDPSDVEDAEDDENVITEEKIDDPDKHRLVSNDKDSNIDDPIRLYLREIGKENLLSAEQEVSLSKDMEEGQNIIKNVIKNSGMMIPEFYTIAHKAFTRIDMHEPGKARKELNEEMAEKHRLRSAYSEYLKPILSEIKAYMALKKQLSENDSSMNIFSDSGLVELKEKNNAAHARNRYSVRRNRKIQCKVY